MYIAALSLHAIILTVHQFILCVDKEFIGAYVERQISLLLHAFVRDERSIVLFSFLFTAGSVRCLFLPLGCSAMNPPTSIILLIFLLFEGLLFFLFTCIMFCTQLCAIWNDETVRKKTNPMASIWFNLTDRSILWLIDWLIDRLTITRLGWLIDWLTIVWVGRLIDWLITTWVGWLIDWLIGFSVFIYRLF